MDVGKQLFKSNVDMRNESDEKIKKKKELDIWKTHHAQKKKEGRKDEKEETISFQIKQFIKYHAYEFSRNMQRLTHTIHAPFFFSSSLSLLF